MTPRQKRLSFVVVGLGAVTLAAYLVFQALGDATAYFQTPTDVVQGKVANNNNFRLGGMVEVGSVERQPDDLTVHFVVTDNANEVTVAYTGILPDLFTEGQGVVAQGKMGPGGLFIADTVLAKHDEKYMPPEVAEALEKGKAMSGNSPATM